MRLLFFSFTLFQVSESDKLPKIVCSQCLIQVETIVKFRETCVNAQSMLESCLNSSKLRNGGKVCICFYFHFFYCGHCLFLHFAFVYYLGGCTSNYCYARQETKILIYLRFISRMCHQKRRQHRHLC